MDHPTPPKNTQGQNAPKKLMEQIYQTTLKLKINYYMKLIGNLRSLVRTLLCTGTYMTTLPSPPISPSWLSSLLQALLAVLGISRRLEGEGSDPVNLLQLDGS